MGNRHSIPSSTESHKISRKWPAGIFRLRRSFCTLGASYTASGASANETHGHLSFKCASEPSNHANNDTDVAYKAFLEAFPEYQLTSTLDDLRKNDFSRLDRTGETYVDYMGGAVYPESLVRMHTTFLMNNVLGNTHSVSNR